MWRVPGLLGRALSRFQAVNVQGCVHGEAEALNPSSLIPLGQNVGSRSYSSQSSGGNNGQNGQERRKRGHSYFCGGQLPQYSVLDAIGVGAAAVFFLHLARQLSFHCPSRRSQEDPSSRRPCLRQILTSLSQNSNLSVSSHIVPKSIPSSAWDGIRLDSDINLQDSDVDTPAPSSGRPPLHHVVQQVDSYSDDFPEIAFAQGPALSREESTSKPAQQLLEPKEELGESLNVAASHLLDVAESSVPTVLNIFGIITARDNGDYRTAFRFFQESADSGYSKAQYNTAVCYEKGRGVAKDMTKAAEYYRLAATGGHQFAKYRYARHLLQSNQGDAEPAVQLLQEAAEAGVKEAQAYLGVFYSKESHFDPQKAARYFWMAAENGDVQSRYHLAVCYERGFGVPASTQEALRHYDRAAKSGHEPAQQRMQVMQQLPEQELSSPLASLRAASSSPCLPVLEKTNVRMKAAYSASSPNALGLPHSMSTGDLLVMSPAASRSYLLPPIHLKAMQPAIASLRAIGVG
ncbi:death ligand signal enhancer [Hyperolius riggenbachi]|uniref:death ligand signal enhancer n=1 Tax=Hyperolius riggenbachi TaxID=752182 RepID=UPI0035A27368